MTLDEGQQSQQKCVYPKHSLYSLVKHKKVFRFSAQHFGNFLPIVILSGLCINTGKGQNETTKEYLIEKSRECTIKDNIDY